jgi:hypothetical protein
MGPAAGEPPRGSQPAAYPSGEAGVRQSHAMRQQMHRLHRQQHALMVRTRSAAPAVPVPNALLPARVTLTAESERCGGCVQDDGSEYATALQYQPVVAPV